MKVLMLTSSYPLGPVTHEGSFIRDLARNLVIRGISPVVIAPHFPGGIFCDLNEGITVFRYPYFLPFRFERVAYGAGIPANICHDFLAFVGIVPFCVTQFFWTLGVFIRVQVDLIHSHWFVPQGFVGALFHRFTGIPHIVTIHGSDLAFLKKTIFFRALYSFIIRNSDAITVNSTYTRRQLVSLLPESAVKIQVIPMGVEPELVKDPAAVNDTRKTGQERIILNIGRLIGLKGTRYLIEAMPAVLRDVPGSHLVIIGSGPEQARLEQVVQERSLGTYVKFLGTVPHDEISSHIRKADVVVLPSVTVAGIAEGLGIVILEAMASGCPVIGSNSGGIPDIITDGENGFLVPEKDPAVLADRIVRVLSDRELRNKFRKNGYARISRSFSWDMVAGRFGEIYEETLKNRCSGRTGN